MNRYVNAHISERQFTILIILGVIGDSILVLPTVIASYVKQDAWLSMLIALFLGLAVGGLFSGIAHKQQRKSLIEVAQSNLGIGLGSVFSLLFLFEIYICSLTLVSEMSQFMTTQMMPETPAEAIIVLYTAVIIIAYRYGVKAFSRMGELLFPMFLGLFVFLVVFLIPQVEMSNLQPLAAKGMGPIISGVLPAFTFGFAEMYILLMLVPHVVGKDSLTKPILWGFFLGGAILFVIVLFCVLVLGPNLMLTKYYPTFVLAQKIEIGNFLERVEVIITFLWIITVFYKSLILFFALTTGISQMLRLKEDRMLTIPLGMLLLVGAVAGTPNVTVYNEIIKNYYPWFDLSFCVLLPALFLLMLYVAGKLRKSKTE